jgi:hypothetical protein
LSADPELKVTPILAKRLGITNVQNKYSGTETFGCYVGFVELFHWSKSRSCGRSVMPALSVEEAE